MTSRMRSALVSCSTARARAIDCDLPGSDQSRRPRLRGLARHNAEVAFAQTAEACVASVRAASPPCGSNLIEATGILGGAGRGPARCGDQGAHQAAPKLWAIADSAGLWLALPSKGAKAAAPSSADAIEITIDATGIDRGLH